MDETHKGFLEYLQTLPEPTKKRVLVIATAVIMALVVYFWLAYFNNLIAGIAQPAATVAENAPAENAPTGQPATAAPATVAVPAAPGEGMGQRLENGLGFIYGIFANMAHGLESVVNAPGQYNVRPPQQ